MSRRILGALNSRLRHYEDTKTLFTEINIKKIIIHKPFVSPIMCISYYGSARKGRTVLRYINHITTEKIRHGFPTLALENKS